MQRTTVHRSVDNQKQDEPNSTTKPTQQIKLINLTPFQEEILNVISHAMFILPCCALTTELCQHSKSSLQLQLSQLYGVCGIFLYLISATYHSLNLFAFTRGTLLDTFVVISRLLLIGFSSSRALNRSKFLAELKYNTVHF